MTAKELAEKLNGRLVSEEISSEEAKEAKEAGLVVVYGYSDDNMEFEGAIHDEVGCYDGGDAYVTPNGILDPNGGCGMRADCDFARSAFAQAKKISAHWGEGEATWSYETDIPHETFDIFDDDGSLFCRGIVFSVEDL